MDWMFDPRFHKDYDDSDSGDGGASWQWSDILLLPAALLVKFLSEILPFLVLAWFFFGHVYSTLKRTINNGKLSHPFLAFDGSVLVAILVIAFLGRPANTPIHLRASLILAIGFVFIFTMLPALALCLHWLIKYHSWLKSKFGGIGSFSLITTSLVICLAAIIFFLNFPSPSSPIQPSPTRTPGPTQTPAAVEPTRTDIPTRSIDILVDDFRPQPYPGDSVYFYNRLEGDRGALNKSIIFWGIGQVKVAIPAGNSSGGLWMSLNHPIREDLPINFSAILPSQILPAYQGRITGVTIQINSGTPGRTFRVGLKDGNTLSWKNEIHLLGGQQSISARLPPLQNISQLVLVLDHADPGDYVVIDRVSLTASTPVTDTATAAFVWSYGMLLNNWDPATGLVRDNAKDASGEFDAVQATGALAAATAVAEQLGIIQRDDALIIANKISNTLLDRLPRNHGLWPHWVQASSEGKIDIVPKTEWSSVDTVIAATGLLDAQGGLGLDATGTEEMLGAIEWKKLVTDKGISHGYTYSNEMIPYAWDTFGGESWLVELAYAGVTGEVAPLAYPSVPTANGSGFIDELAWLYIRPPSEQDYWGTDWSTYRMESADQQISYYAASAPRSCLAQLGLFGLSAGEVPSPARAPEEDIYQAFGLGGQFGPANDGSVLLGSPVISPHYSAMIASLRPERAIQVWDWLIADGHFSPLNNVESLTFPANTNCQPEGLEWNQLKGSWNLSLQTLGWGRYLAERNGQVPVLWQATNTSPLLHKGYLLLSPNEPSPGRITRPK